MLNCKIFGHKWHGGSESVGGEGFRKCSRCGFTQKYKGFTVTLNRTELASVAKNRVSTQMWKKYWWVILIGFAFFFSAVGVEGWVSNLLLAVGVVILGFSVVAFIRKASKELDGLTK